MTRVYLPTTMSSLAEAFVSGGFGAGHTAHAVTPAVREWYTEGGTEELEYVAFNEAVRASLRLLAMDVTALERYENRRVVVAADLDAGCVEPGLGVLAGDGPDGPASSRSSVRLSCTVPMAKVVSVHVDGEEARAVVAEAVRGLPAADAGDDDAAFAVEEADARELLWYDVTEVADLI